jgi:hypothetical protein
MGFDYEDVIGGTLSCFQPVSFRPLNPNSGKSSQLLGGCENRRSGCAPGVSEAVSHSH